MRQAISNVIWGYEFDLHYPRLRTIFVVAIARTGLREAEAQQTGYEPLTIDFETWDHKVYYPNAHSIVIHIIGNINTRTILGAQIIGNYQGEVAKRVDIFATAIFHRMTIEQISDLDLSYTPPLSSPWNPVQMAAQAWSKQANLGAKTKLTSV